ncbi:HlyD family secretion protein [Tropicimonas sp. IMCC34043]|uniref:HlyD family secretion protein n=1 Tax=Tropicimonas sp. IMCC34043 TaxID=2248760 RepID=UPI00130061A7|nr:HlyD family secretion protein [Tropicimonas sp. IMCC34043]
MLAVVAITVLYLFFIWIIFIKLKWLRLTPVWGVVSAFFLLHLLFVPLIGMRFVAPFSADVRLVRQTIQITPRLPEPTIVEQVLVTEGQHVNKGDPLFLLDSRVYQYQVDEATAALEGAKQNVVVLQEDINVAQETVARSEAELKYKQSQAKRYTDLAAQRAAPEAEAQRWQTDVATAEAQVAESEAQLKRAEAVYASQIDGVNTGVLAAEAQLRQAQFYLDQTTIRAPDDGMIVNLQVQPGMVAGIIRAGAIASFIADRDPYLLAMYRQENIKFMKPGQDALVSLNLRPGDTFKAKVKDIWWASGRGQMLPSGRLPSFVDLPTYPEGRLAVQIVLEDPPDDLPIGAEGAALVLTDESSPFTWIGQIVMRTHTWGRWVYPMPF